jgi:predicted kinase
MEAVILVGLQASGKTTFCKNRLFDSHIRINYDMLRTRYREGLFLNTCIESKQRFVVDNTNPTALERERYIKPAKNAGFKVVGYFFPVDVPGCTRRNETRTGKERVPEKGIWATVKKLEPPKFAEGFDEIFFVEIAEEPGQFRVSTVSRESDGNISEGENIEIR